MASSLCDVSVWLTGLSRPSHVPVWWHCITPPFFLPQALGFPGDDLTAVPWQRPRCDEGPLLLLLSSQLPAPLPVLQNLRRAVLPVRRRRLLARVISVLGPALQTSALLPPDGAASHCQHAAAEAQLALPEPRRCFRWTPSTRRCSKGLRCLASGHGKPAPWAFWRPRWRWDGRRHQHGEPKLRFRWDYRLWPRGRGGSHVAGGGARLGPSQRAARALAGSERVRLHVRRAGRMLTYKKEKTVTRNWLTKREKTFSPLFCFCLSSLSWLIKWGNRRDAEWERERDSRHTPVSILLSYSQMDKKKKTACFWFVFVCALAGREQTVPLNQCIFPFQDGIGGWN